MKCWLYTTLRREYLQSGRAHNSHLHVEFRPEIHDIPCFSGRILSISAVWTVRVKDEREFARRAKQQGELDSFIASKLGEIQPPAVLPVSILAGLENRPRRWPVRWPLILVLAAVFVLSGFILLPIYMDQDWGQKWLREFQRADLAMLSSLDLPKHLDLVTDNFAKTQEYLAKMNVPLPRHLRGRLLAAQGFYLEKSATFDMLQTTQC